MECHRQKKWKFLKNEKTAFYICVPKIWSNDVQFLRHGAQQTYIQTDRWKKWHIEVGAPPKNQYVEDKEHTTKIQ